MILQRLMAPLALASALCGLPPAGAQHAVTAYGGVRTGSGFEQAPSPNAPIDVHTSGAVSIGIDWPLDAARPYQLLLSHQRTRLNLGAPTTPGAPSELPLQVSYVHLGGLNFYEGQVGRGPYVAGGLGVTYLSPRLEGTSSRLRASMNLGLGYQWPINPTMALRTELRGYLTLIRSNGSFFCSGGGCVVSIKGDTLTQAEAMLGLTFGF